MVVVPLVAVVAVVAVVVRVADICVADVVATDGKAEQFAALKLGLSYAVIIDGAEAFARNKIPTITHYQQKSALNFGANKYGNFTIYEKDGTISLNFRRN